MGCGENHLSEGGTAEPARRPTALGFLLRFLRRFALLCLMFLLVGLLIGGDEFTFTMFAAVAVALAPLLLLQRFIIGPRFPYLRPGILVVMLLVVIAECLIGMPSHFDRHQKIMVVVRVAAFDVPTVAAMGMLYGFIVDMADRLYRHLTRERGEAERF